jgi:hypothetical protein
MKHLIAAQVWQKKSNLELEAAKPSAPSCEGSGEEALGIEPVHPSCEGVLIPVHGFIPLDHRAFFKSVGRTRKL